MRRDDIAEGTRVTVMGLGRFGGGLGVARFLAQRGCDVLVTDLAHEEALAEPLAELKPFVDDGSVRLRLGGHNVSDFTDTDLVVASPAVPRPRQNRFLRAASAAGVPITTEVRLGLENLNPSGFSARPAPGPGEPHVVGITGTAGKSTTAAMVHASLNALGVRAELAGNIGRSLLDEDLRGAVTSGSVEVLVLELSSAQLFWLGHDVGYIGAEPWGCDTAVVTSFTPNHLDWHEDMLDYEACKQQLLFGTRSSRKPALIVLGPGVSAWRDAVPGLFDDIASLADARDAAGRLVVSERVLEDGAIAGTRTALPGAHNTMNACLAAIAAHLACDRRHDPAACFEHAAAFPGLPHRLNLVHTSAAGVRAFDDSKCTTPGGTALAVGAFNDPGDVVLIAGGYDKGVDLSPMFASAARCALVCTIGATGNGIAAGVEAAGGAALRCKTLERAAEAAAKRAGELLNAGREPVVLLSPGCASWDQFKNYEQRGDRFARLIEGALP
jgi:UDP-N-acetylmuramoylalanine--D-glutamate ligase